MTILLSMTIESLMILAMESWNLNEPACGLRFGDEGHPCWVANLGALKSHKARWHSAGLSPCLVGESQAICKQYLLDCLQFLRVFLRCTLGLLKDTCDLLLLDTFSEIFSREFSRFFRLIKKNMCLEFISFSFGEGNFLQVRRL